MQRQTEKTRTCDASGLAKWADKPSEAQRGKVSVPVLQHPVTSQGENPSLFKCPPAISHDTSVASLLGKYRWTAVVVMEYQHCRKARWKVSHFVHGAYILCVLVFSALEKFEGIVHYLQTLVSTSLKISSRFL